METKNILIIVKTYPEISAKYTETVCTGGILAESRKLVRIYPIRYRYLEGENQFAKYQWISAKIKKAGSDSRPESFNIVEDTIELGTVIAPGRDWSEREEWVLHSDNVYGSLEELLQAQSQHDTSLGIIKPKEILKFKIEDKSESEIKAANAKKENIIRQHDMFEDRRDLDIIPYRFMLHFNCNNSECRGHKISILDWEFGQLYRNVNRSKNWKEKIEDKVADICGDDKETYLIMGNMAGRRHTFCILGFFYPPKIRQRSIFS